MMSLDEGGKPTNAFSLSSALHVRQIIDIVAASKARGTPTAGGLRS